MTLYVRDVGGSAWVDVASYGVVVSAREGWLDSVSWEQNLIQLPGTYVWRNLGGDPSPARRAVTVAGALTADDADDVRDARRAFEPIIAQPDLVEFHFGDTGLALTAQGYGSIRYAEIRPILKLPGQGRFGSLLTITFDCPDPVRYDLTGGGMVAVDTIPAIGAASSTAPLPS